MKKHITLLLAICTSVILFAAAPTITSFTPASGTIGTLVTITGTNLGSPTNFKIGGTSAIIISNNGSTLVGMVMPGTINGTINITTVGGSATSNGTFTVTAEVYPTHQQGNKLISNGAVANTEQNTCAISADGNTAIVGAAFLNGEQGGVWIFIRSGGQWTQQTGNLLGNGTGGELGYAVAISADGNTAIASAPEDSSSRGALYVYTRSGTTWTQQGPKLRASDEAGISYLGLSVSLSADGNTVVTGGDADNGNLGAAWVFTRTGSAWSQLGNKLLGTGGTYNEMQGSSVAISADGNTIAVGGEGYKLDTGAVWIFVRNGNAFTQQGNLLVGTGYIGGAYQGACVSLSADGNTLIEGGATDNNHAGAVWFFTRSGTNWTQQGSKVTPNDETGGAGFGSSVSLTADGNTAVIGGPGAYEQQGNFWLFARSGNTWSQYGTKLYGTGSVFNLGAADQGSSCRISADGTTLIEASEEDNSYRGAAWVFSTGPTILPITLSFTGDSVVPCNPQCNASVSVAATGGQGPYSYLWNTSPTQTTAAVQNLCPGTYTVTVSDTSNNTATATVHVKLSQQTAVIYDTVTLCYGQSLLGHSATGFYTDTLVTQSGCDSIVKLNLTVVSSFNDSVIASGAVCATIQTGSAYQWVNCTTGQPVANGSSQLFTATQDGSYRCIITVGNCADTTSCVTIGKLGIEEGTAYSFSLYPNPSTGMITIQHNYSGNLQVQVINTLGNPIKEFTVSQTTDHLDVTEFADGVYYAFIYADKQLLKVMKLVKQ